MAYINTIIHNFYNMQEFWHLWVKFAKITFFINIALVTLHFFFEKDIFLSTTQNEDNLMTPC